MIFHKFVKFKKLKVKNMMIENDDRRYDDGKKYKNANIFL